MMKIDIDESTIQIQDVEEKEKIPIFVYYQWKDSISVRDRKVELEEALDLLNRQPSKSEYPSNHIGFMTKTSMGCIQFVNEDNGNWWFDIPIYGEIEDKYDWTEEVFQAFETFDKVQLFVEEYFRQGDMFKSLQSYEHDIFLKISAAMGIEWKGYIPSNVMDK